MKNLEYTRLLTDSSIFVFCSALLLSSLHKNEDQLINTKKRTVLVHVYYGTVQQEILVMAQIQ
jgi:hypothetical protein